jgi:hypothetical protein
MERAYKTVLINLVTRPSKAFATIYSYDLYKYKYIFFALIGVAIVVVPLAILLMLIKH